MTVIAHKIEGDAQWKRLRKGLVTASRAACCLGLDPHATPFEYYLELCGERPPLEETKPMRRGRLLEPVAVTCLREDFPSWRFWEPRTFYVDNDAGIGATPDLFAEVPGVPGFVNVQIKSVEPSIFRKQWIAPGEGEDEARGDIEPPLHYAVQTIIEAHLAGCSRAYVAPLRVGFGLDIDLLEVPITQNVIDAVYAAAADMHTRVVLRDAPPVDYRRDADLLASLYDVAPGKTIDLTGDNWIVDLLDEHARLAKVEKDAAKDRKACRAEIAHKLGDAEVATIGTDGTRITYKQIVRGAYHVAASAYRQLHITDKRERTNAKDERERSTIHNGREPPV